MHDFLGLTDREISRRGREHHVRYGTAASEVTFGRRPTLLLLHSGDGHLNPIRRAAGGRFDEEYLTLSLEQMPGSCRGAGWRAILRRDEAARLLPALERFSPRALTEDGLRALSRPAGLATSASSRGDSAGETD
jgi:hypothetical protein